MSMTENRGRFAPGRSGNPAGRATGSRNRTTTAVQALLEGEAEEISRMAVTLAKAGDLTAIKLVLDRVLPVRKDRPIVFSLPPIDVPDDLTRATAALLSAVSNGELTPSEAAEIGKLVDAHVRAVEATEVAKRLDRLEAAGQAKR